MNHIRIAMQKIPDEFKESIRETRSMEMAHIIDDFNSEATDLINYLAVITKKYKVYKESNLASNMYTLGVAIRHNRELPILKFSSIAMEHAHEIFTRNEQYFHHLDIPEGKLGAGDSFTLIKPEIFKKIGAQLTEEEKQPIFDHVTVMATLSCAYFANTAASQK